MREKMLGIEGPRLISHAIKRWLSAFKQLGRTDHGFDPTLVWIEELGIWLNSKGRITGDGFRYWNGLGMELGGRSVRNLVVEVNPRPAGGPPGRFQGVVAKDSQGDIWILHRGELNVGGFWRNLKDEEFREMAAAAKFDVVEVEYEDGSRQECHRVALLGDDPITIVSDTKKFLDFCLTVRTLVMGGEEEAKIQREAGLFEEPTGPYTIGPQSAKEVERIHGQVFKALKNDLLSAGQAVANERVGSLGPDLYTKGKGSNMLFEIKTGNGASDILKAVGQLIVYEKILKKSYRKVMVLPHGVSDLHRSLVGTLGIEIVDYSAKGKSYYFDWPKSMLTKPKIG